MLTTALGCAFIFNSNAEQSPLEFVNAYNTGYQSLEIPEIQLSYQAYIKSLITAKNIDKQDKFFTEIDQQLKLLPKKGFDICLALDIQKIRFEVALHRQLLTVINKHLTLEDKELTNKGLYHNKLGQEWYKYLLKFWLTVDTSPKELIAFGEKELNNALLRYQKLQDQMGFKAKDRDFYNHLSGNDYIYINEKTPLDDYVRKQKVVWSKLGKLFKSYDVKPAHIKQSEYGNKYPVDAYYEGKENTFYFNKSKTHYEKRGMDMLLLHEGAPGHHFQKSIEKLPSNCRSLLPERIYYAFSEGWAAYVEEFGETLGIYQNLSDKLGDVEWDLVRSIRVVLDVSINHLGWTHQQALAYWHNKLPMLPELAEREINRVRNWPAQAITYKKGADVIRQLRKELKKNSDFDIKKFHHQVLKNGSVPLQILETNIL